MYDYTKLKDHSYIISSERRTLHKCVHMSKRNGEGGREGGRERERERERERVGVAKLCGKLDFSFGQMFTNSGDIKWWLAFRGGLLGQSLQPPASLGWL